MSQAKTGAQSPELEALFQAARAIESALIRERAQIAQQEADLAAQATRHAAELEHAKIYAQKLLARDQELCRHISAAQTKIQDYAAYCARLQQSNERLNTEVQAHAKKNDLNLTAARASFHQMKKKNHGLQEQLERLLPELARTRDELERAQGEVLDREHRYQASVLSYQGRDRHQLDAMADVKNQLKRTQDELAQYKSRWLEAERQRQESDQARQEAETTLKRQVPSMDKLKELEETNRSLEQRIAIERRQRQQADSGIQAESQEREMLQSALRATEERLSYTEARLSKAAAEAALLKATRMERSTHSKRAPTHSPAPRHSDALSNFGDSLDLEMLEKLALPGYPIQEA
jgi:chromosome segregation ATPase